MNWDWLEGNYANLGDAPKPSHSCSRTSEMFQNLRDAPETWRCSRTQSLFLLLSFPQRCSRTLEMVQNLRDAPEPWRSPEPWRCSRAQPLLQFLASWLREQQQNKFSKTWLREKTDTGSVRHPGTGPSTLNVSLCLLALLSTVYLPHQSSFDLLLCCFHSLLTGGVSVLGPGHLALSFCYSVVKH